MTTVRSEVNQAKPPLAAAVRDWMARTDVRGDGLRLMVLTLLQFAGGLENGATSASVSHASLAELANIMGRNERTVRRRLETLRELHYLSWVQRRHLHLPSVYQLTTNARLQTSRPDRTPTCPVEQSVPDRTNGSSDRTNNASRPDSYVSNKGFDLGLEAKGASCLAEKRETQTPLNSPSTAKATTDPRHVPIRDLIQKLHREHFGVSCPWTGREGKRFSKFLASVPDWPLEKLKIAVLNYFGTRHTKPGAPPFNELPRYAEYALDEFGHPSERITGEQRRKVRQWMQYDAKALKELTEAQ